MNLNSTHIYEAHESFKLDEEKWINSINDYLKSYNLFSRIYLSDKNTDNILHRIHFEDTKKFESDDLISVIMPAYNAEETIEYSINSILNQTYQNIEILIVDDCSTDKTYEIIKDFAKKDGRIQHFKNKVNVGPYVIKNIMINKAKGKYVAFHDADDLSYIQSIECQYKSIKSISNCYCNLTLGVRILKNGIIENSNNYDGFLRPSFCTFMFEKNTIQKYFGYWDCVKFAADGEFIDRIEKCNLKTFLTYLYIPGCFYYRRKNSLTTDPQTCISSKIRNEYRSNYKLYHKNLNLNNIFMPFPHSSNRLFEAPTDMIIPEEHIKEVLQ